MRLELGNARPAGTMVRNGVIMYSRRCFCNYHLEFLRVLDFRFRLNQKYSILKYFPSEILNNLFEREESKKARAVIEERENGFSPSLL